MSAIRVVRQLATCGRARLATSVFRASGTAILRPSGSSRAFSVSRPSFADSSSSEIARTLNAELKYELENKEEDLPAFLTEFHAEDVWEIQDTLGNEEVFLTRKFGDENIRVMFTIADLHNLDEEDDLEDEEAKDEEEQKVTEPTPEFRLSVSISKPSHPGALGFDIYCSDGMLETATVAFYKTAKIGQELSIESDFARRTLYQGPLFEMLDEGLQGSFEQFLQERGINEALARFVLEYSTYKEQNEYVKWLASVHKFVKA